MAAKFFLFLCIYCVVPIMYVTLRNETKAKKNIILGVTLPYTARQTPEVEKVCSDFRRSLLIWTVILTALALPSLLFEPSSKTLTWLLTWLVAALVVPLIVYARYNKRLRAVKEAGGWGNAGRKTVIDTSAAVRQEPKTGVAVFIPAIVLSAFPILYALLFRPGDPMFASYLVCGAIFLLTVLFIVVCHRRIYHQKSDVVDGNTGLTEALTRVRRYNWSKNCIWISYLTAAYSVASVFLTANAKLFFLATLVYAGVIIWICMRTEFRARRAQEKLCADSGQDFYTDDDDHWLWGLFYLNPNDDHLLINNRTGLNMGVNLAKPAGKIIMLLSALLVLALPFIGVFISQSAATPIRIETNETSVSVCHTKKVFDISYDEVSSAELLRSLPPSTRIVGSGFDDLLKGTFSVDTIGRCRLCLNPKNGAFIKLDTARGIFIISAEDDTETMRVYDTIKSEIQEE